MKKISLLFSLLIFIGCVDNNKTSQKKSKSTSSKNNIVNTLENSDCAEFIELLSAKEVAKEYGASVQWVLANHKVNVWQLRGSSRGKKVGELLPGSRALILEKFENEYKIRSPLDKSIGYVSKIQVKKTLMQHPKTFELCR